VVNKTTKRTEAKIILFLHNPGTVGKRWAKNLEKELDIGTAHLFVTLKSMMDKHWIVKLPKEPGEVKVQYKLNKEELFDIAMKEWWGTLDYPG